MMPEPEMVFLPEPQPTPVDHYLLSIGPLRVFPSGPFLYLLGTPRKNEIFVRFCMELDFQCSLFLHFSAKPKFTIFIVQRVLERVVNSPKWNQFMSSNLAHYLQQCRYLQSRFFQGFFLVRLIKYAINKYVPSVFFHLNFSSPASLVFK